MQVAGYYIIQKILQWWTGIGTYNIDYNNNAYVGCGGRGGDAYILLSLRVQSTPYRKYIRRYTVITYCT